MVAMGSIPRLHAEPAMRKMVTWRCPLMYRPLTSFLGYKSPVCVLGPMGDMSLNDVILQARNRKIAELVLQSMGGVGTHRSRVHCLWKISHKGRMIPEKGRGPIVMASGNWESHRYVLVQLFSSMEILKCHQIPNHYNINQSISCKCS